MLLVKTITVVTKYMDEIHFKPATLNDLPFLYEFEQLIIEYERPYDETLRPDPINYYDLKAMIQSDDAEIIVAVVGDELIGSGYANIKRSQEYLKHTHYVQLGFMYTHPEFRGKGINEKIIKKLINWVHSKNLKEVRLDVYSDNESAIRAYEKSGFKKHMINMRTEIRKST